MPLICSSHPRSHLSHPLHRSPERMWTISIVWILLIWSYPLHTSPDSTWTWSIVFKTSHLILFIHLQNVRELGQLFEYSSSDHPIPSSLSISRMYHIMYVKSVNCFKMSHLIIHPLQDVREFGQLFEYASSDHPIPPSPERTWTWSIVWITPHLIIPSHPCLQKVRDLCLLFLDFSSES